MCSTKEEIPAKWLKNIFCCLICSESIAELVLIYRCPKNWAVQCNRKVASIHYWSSLEQAWKVLNIHVSWFQLLSVERFKAVLLTSTVSLFILFWCVFFFFSFLAPAYRMQRVTPLGILSLVLNIMCGALNLIRGVHLAEHSFQVTLTDVKAVSEMKKESYWGNQVKGGCSAL